MSAEAGSGPPDQGPLAIICGAGTLPFAVADAVREARPRGGAVRASRLGRSAARGGLQALLGRARPVRLGLPPGTRRRLPRHRLHRHHRPSAALAAALRLGDPADPAARGRRLSRRRQSSALGRRQGFRAGRLPSGRRPRGRAGHPDARGCRQQAPAECAGSGGYGRRGCACWRRSGSSTSARRRWSPAIMCWRSRAWRVPTGCWNGSPSCAAARSAARAACW